MRQYMKRLLSLVPVLLFADACLAQTPLVTNEQMNVDVYNLLNAHSISEYEDLRESLTDFVWGGSGLPSGKMPDLDVDYTAHRPPWILPPNTSMRAAHIRDAITPDVYSVLFLLEPPVESDCLFVYNFGHAGQFLGAGPQQGERDLINAMLNRGCDVAVSMMPFAGSNQTTSTTFPNAIPDGLHNYFADAEKGGLTPIRYFLTPPVTAITWASSRHGAYSRVAMAGLSGGGWTTTFVAALDARVTNAYSVAGSMPMHLRSGSSMGDWEQSSSAWLQIAGYLDLYILGGLEGGRTAAQIWNPGDKCCFNAVLSYTFTNQLSGIASRMGIGGLKFFVTEAPFHTVSPNAVNYIKVDFFGAS